MVELADVVVQWFHHVKVDCGTDPGKTQLQPEHEIQLLAFEPEHCIVVLSHCQRLAPDSVQKFMNLTFNLCWLFLPKNESTKNHEPEFVQNASKGKH
jgi:hypothetical protein